MKCRNPDVGFRAGMGWWGVAAILVGSELDMQSLFVFGIVSVVLGVIGYLASGMT